KKNQPGVATPVKISFGGIVEPLEPPKRPSAADGKVKVNKNAALANKQTKSRKTSETGSSVKSRIKMATQKVCLQAEHARIIAIIPTYEKEQDIDKTVISLLLQTRQVDQIAVVINGPGESDAAYNAILPLAQEFRDQLIIERPFDLNGRNIDGSSKGSKVNALNWMYWRYIQMGDYDFVLGLDADVVADRDMVHHLERDLIRRVRAGGVMARYSFKIPTSKDLRGKSLSLIHGQRHEFAVTGIRQQLRGYRSEILGGQATLFRAHALREAARVTDGGAPWDSETLVEDAELTRTLQKLGYTNATSADARAWVGLMFTPHTWQRQRRKWQDGHFTDMIRDFHPWIDRRRWFKQIALGWNLTLRVLFAAVLITSIALNQFIFSPLWFIPIVLAIIQSILVATKVPNPTFREIVRSIMFIPGEIYYTRILAVWLDSALMAIANVQRDGWANQHKAEAAVRRSAFSSWLLIITTIATPTVAIFMANRFLPVDVISNILTTMWYTVTILTVGSTVSMAYFILRIIRNYRTLAP
ncbi:glycosyltransferase family 2 protein, partial [Candidatus Saccharibacteria bacterium]|nr:glycosyltransferase family 2 protein [Candidatus Saccharibacteria bacterium]